MPRWALGSAAAPGLVMPAAGASLVLVLAAEWAVGRIAARLSPPPGRPE